MARERTISGTTYVLVLIVLLVLTAISWGLSYLFSGGVEIVVGLAIGFLKAGLVVLFFMHVLEARFAVQVVSLVTAIFIVLLCAGMVADVGLR